MDEEVFAFGSFRFIPARAHASKDGKPLRVGSRVFDILVALVERAGETISKEELIVRAWPDTVVEEAALRVRVVALRKALGDGRAGKRYVANHPGCGFAFIAPVTRENTPSASATANGTDAVGVLPTLLTRIVGRTRGRRTALPRKQTLRAAIDWSNDLLSEPERCLLRFRRGLYARGG